MYSSKSHRCAAGPLSKVEGDTILFPFCLEIFRAESCFINTSIVQWMQYKSDVFLFCDTLTMTKSLTISYQRTSNLERIWRNSKMYREYVLFCLQTCAIYRAESQVLHSVSGEVAGGNYTYYSLMYKGPITLYLHST